MKNKFLALLLATAMVISSGYMPVKAADSNGSETSAQTETQESTSEEKSEEAKEAEAAADDTELTQEEITEELTQSEENKVEAEAKEAAEAVEDQVDAEDIEVDPEDPETARLTGHASSAFYGTESVSDGQVIGEETADSDEAAKEAEAADTDTEDTDDSSSSEAAVGTASATGTASTFTSYGYSHDNRFSGSTITKGIDVSYHNQTIDWAKVKAAGINFAIIRVGYRSISAGSLNYDVKYKENLVNAAKAGVNVGVYIYSQAMTVKEAQEEAAYILEGIKGYDVNLPVVFDYEYYPGGRFSSASSGGLTDQNRTDICLAFVEKVKEAGYTPMVYANKSMLTSDLYASQISAKSKIWLARYNSYAGYDGDYEYWQYSSTGKVNGISTNVDMNFHYGSSTQAPSMNATSSRVDKVSLSWAEVSGAAGYRLQRYNSSKKKYVTIYVGSKTSYTDTGRSTNTKYKYRICSYKKVDGKNKCGKYGAVVSVRTKKTVFGRLNTALNVRKSASTSSGVLTEASLGTAVTVIGSKSSWYKIKLSVKGKTKTGYVLKSRVTMIAQQKLTATAGSASVTLSWNANTSADGYNLQRYDASKGAYVTIKTITDTSTTSYTDTGLTSGSTYKYRVASYKTYSEKKLCGKYSAAVTVTAK